MSYYAFNSYDPKPIRRELIEALARGADYHWYALVDTAFDHGLKQLNWPGGDAFAIYHQGRLAPMADASPTLFPLSRHDDNQQERELIRLLHHCHGRPMLSFVCSALGPKALREHWQSTLEIETADGLSYLLRFSDTRVLPVIASVLRDDVWGRLCGGVKEWLCFDRTGQLYSLPLLNAGASSGVEFVASPLVINDDSLAQLLRASQEDALADMLNEHFPELLLSVPGATAYKWLEATCRQAEKQWIETPGDLMALAVAVCLSEGALLESEQFTAWLGEKPWLSGDFADILGQWMEDYPQ